MGPEAARSLRGTRRKSRVRSVLLRPPSLPSRGEAPARPPVITDLPEGGDGDNSRMTVTVLDPALVTGDAGWVTGKRQERADPEVPELSRRRMFTAQYKLDVVAEYDAAPPGEKGAVLRCEGTTPTRGPSRSTEKV